VHVIGFFIIRIYYDARSPERQAEAALLNSLSVSVLEHVVVRKSPPQGQPSASIFVLKFYIILLYLLYRVAPKKCIHSLLINIFGINLNGISVSG
jgi:hypothetical protein